MKHLNSILLGTTAAILVLGGAPASAQKTPDASGGAQMQGGADANVQGNQSGGANAQGGANVQGGANMNKGSAGAEAQGKTQGRAQTGQGDTKARGEADSKSRTTTQGKADSDSSARAKKQKGDAEDGTQGRAQTQQGDTEGRSEGRALGGSEQSGGDRAGGGRGDRGDDAVQFTEEHKTKLTTYFKQNKVSVEPVQEVNVSISVGTVIPQTVELHPLPQAIVVDLPDDHDYHYFVYERDIIVVIAGTREIVYVISNAV